MQKHVSKMWKSVFSLHCCYVPMTNQPDTKTGNQCEACATSKPPLKKTTCFSTGISRFLALSLGLSTFRALKSFYCYCCNNLLLVELVTCFTAISKTENPLWSNDSPGLTKNVLCNPWPLRKRPFTCHTLWKYLATRLPYTAVEHFPIKHMLTEIWDLCQAHMKNRTSTVWLLRKAQYLWTIPTYSAIASLQILFLCHFTFQVRFKTHQITFC